MQTFNRFEFKYLVSKTDAIILHQKLIRFGMGADPAAVLNPNHAYTVNSLYFDTPTMEDYADKAGGFLARKKIRIRIYTQKLDAQTKEIWLEKKEKHEMLVSKKRIRLSHEDYKNLIAGSALTIVHENREFLPIIAQSMRPKVEVRYKRIPLVYPHQDNLRITFDSHIEACANNDLRMDHQMKKILFNQTIMEVKFSVALPHWFRALLDEFHLERLAFSKYGRSVEKIHQLHPIPR